MIFLVIISIIVICFSLFVFICYCYERLTFSQFYYYKKHGFYPDKENK